MRNNIFTANMTPIITVHAAFHIFTQLQNWCSFNKRCLSIAVFKKHTMKI